MTRWDWFHPWKRDNLGTSGTKNSSCCHNLVPRLPLPCGERREPEVAISANHSMAESVEGIDGEESKRNVNAFQVAVIGGGLSGTGLTRYNFIFVMRDDFSLHFTGFLRFVCSEGPSGVQYWRSSSRSKRSGRWEDVYHNGKVIHVHTELQNYRLEIYLFSDSIGGYQGSPEGEDG